MTVSVRRQPLQVYEVGREHVVVEVEGSGMQLHVVHTNVAESPTLAWWEDDNGRILSALRVAQA